MSAAAWTVDALLASTLLMAAVLLVRGAVRRAFGAQVAYALWALPVLRLLLPPLPAGWWHSAAAAPITRAGETVTIYMVEPLAARHVAAPAGLSLGLVLAFAWGIGALLFLGWHVVRHRRFCADVLRAAEPIEERDGVAVVASAAVPGPLAFGVRRRVVAFPADFAERYDADERALALAHELGHHRRRDLLANWAALGVLALHWFSPIAWAAFRAFRADQELANDAGVIARCGGQARHAYGRAIVKAATGGVAVATTCHLHTIADLKGRLRMLTISHTSRRRLATGSAAVTLLVAGGLGLTASGNAAARVTSTLAAPLPPVPALAAVQAPPPAVPATRNPAPAPARKHVVVVRNGETRTYDGAAADAYLAEHRITVAPAPPAPPMPPRPGEQIASVTNSHQRIVVRDGAGNSTSYVVDYPEVRNMNCAGNGPATMSEGSDGHRAVIICSNRIDAMVDRAQQQAGLSERHARAQARASLGLARSAIERDRNLTDDQRREALAGVAQAEAELRAD